MEALVLGIHIVVCLLLIIVVLLQSGKSADLAGAFGGAGTQSTFGPRGAATFLSKMTTTLAILFMVTSLTLWILAANKAKASSVIQDEAEVTQQKTTETPKADESKPAVSDEKKSETEPGKTEVNTDAEQPKPEAETPPTKEDTKETNTPEPKKDGETDKGENK